MSNEASNKSASKALSTVCAALRQTLSRDNRVVAELPPAALALVDSAAGLLDGEAVSASLGDSFGGAGTKRKAGDGLKSEDRADVAGDGNTSATKKKKTKTPKKRDTKGKR